MTPSAGELVGQRRARLGPYVRLYRWASRQQENFLTDAFATTLELLSQHEPAILHALLAEWFGWTPTGDVTIHAQVAGQDGRPDLLIEDDTTAWFVEVNIDAPLGPRQLERYKREQRNHRRTHVALISRRIYAHAQAADVVLRWSDIDRSIQRHDDGASPVAALAIRWLHELLEEHDMSDELVSYSIGEGVKQFRSALRLMRASLEAHGNPMRGKRFNSTPDWHGVKPDARNTIVGINTTDSYAFTFQSRDPADPFTDRLDLLETRFFDQSPTRQAQVLHEWLGTNLQRAGLRSTPGSLAPAVAPLTFCLGQGIRDMRRFFEHLRDELTLQGFNMHGKNAVNCSGDWTGIVVGSATPGQDFCSIGFEDEASSELRLHHRKNLIDRHDLTTAGYFELDAAGQQDHIHNVVNQWLDRHAVFAGLKREGGTP